ncbi:MAG TPA: hypothetical protein VJX67_27560, partial [Blastocatellia bacterium]|nr:hypothetical protein [Blastocatellia bacterium]
FTGGLPELIRLHETAAPPSLRGRNRKVPRKMARVIMSALAKDPAGRPESAAALAAALRATGEGIGVLVRQSVSLYSEQFPALLKVSLLGYLPLLAILLVNYLSGRLIPWQGLSQPVATIAGLVLGVLLPMLGHFLSYFIVSGAAVPIVVQLMAAPLSHISIRTAMGRLKRRWWAFFKTSLAVVLIVVAGTALFFVLAFIAASSTSMFAIVIALAGTVLCLIPMMAAAAYYSLYAPVVVMEGLGVWATLRRASTLMKRTWTPVVMITILQFALPILELALGNNLNLRISTTEVNFSFHFSNDASSILPQMLNVLITPLTTVMAALLYLKTRQAGGETINEVIETLDQPEFLGGKWQARMRGPSRPA